jgi:hypothetical protein
LGYTPPARQTPQRLVHRPLGIALPAADFIMVVLNRIATGADVRKMAVRRRLFVEDCQPATKSATKGGGFCGSLCRGSTKTCSERDYFCGVSCMPIRARIKFSPPKLAYASMMAFCSGPTSAAARAAACPARDAASFARATASSAVEAKAARSDAAGSESSGELGTLPIAVRIRYSRGVSATSAGRNLRESRATMLLRLAFVASGNASRATMVAAAFLVLA